MKKFLIIILSMVILTPTIAMAEEECAFSIVSKYSNEPYLPPEGANIEIWERNIFGGDTLCMSGQTYNKENSFYVSELTNANPACDKTSCSDYYIKIKTLDIEKEAGFTNGLTVIKIDAGRVYFSFKVWQDACSNTERRVSPGATVFLNAYKTTLGFTTGDYQDVEDKVTDTNGEVTFEVDIPVKINDQYYRKFKAWAHKSMGGISYSSDVVDVNFWATPQSYIENTLSMKRVEQPITGPEYFQNCQEKCLDALGNEVSVCSGKIRLGAVNEFGRRIKDKEGNPGNLVFELWGKCDTTFFGDRCPPNNPPTVRVKGNYIFLGYKTGDSVTFDNLRIGETYKALVRYRVGSDPKFWPVWNFGDLELPFVEGAETGKLNKLLKVFACKSYCLPEPPPGFASIIINLVGIAVGQIPVPLGDWFLPSMGSACTIGGILSNIPFIGWVLSPLVDPVLTEDEMIKNLNKVKGFINDEIIAPSCEISVNVRSITECNNGQVQKKWVWKMRSENRDLKELRSYLKYFWTYKAAKELGFIGGDSGGGYPSQDNNIIVSKTEGGGVRPPDFP